MIKAVVAALLAFLLYLWGDSLHDDYGLVNVKTAADNSASWEIGGVEMTRFIGKDTWDIEARTVIRDLPVEKMFDVTAVITGESGLRTVNAVTGDYNGKTKDLTLNDADGIWKRERYPLKWETPLAHHTQKDDRWDFPKGVTVIGDVYSLECDSAVVSRLKNIHVTCGHIVWWTK